MNENFLFNQFGLKRAKKRTKVLHVHQEAVIIEDGTMVLKDFKNPYVDISADAFSIKSSLENGVGLKPITPSPLEGQQGSDKLRAEIESVMN